MLQEGSLKTVYLVDHHQLRTISLTQADVSWYPCRIGLLTAAHMYETDLAWSASCNSRTPVRKVCTMTHPQRLLLQRRIQVAKAKQLRQFVSDSLDEVRPIKR